jgi:hypothetical protein
MQDAHHDASHPPSHAALLLLWGDTPSPPLESHPYSYSGDCDDMSFSPTHWCQLEGCMSWQERNPRRPYSVLVPSMCHHLAARHRPRQPLVLPRLHCRIPLLLVAPPPTRSPGHPGVSPPHPRTPMAMLVASFQGQFRRPKQLVSRSGGAPSNSRCCEWFRPVVQWAIVGTDS